MAKKTIGRLYILGKADGKPRWGNYYFGGYCDHCGYKKFLSEYDAYEFVQRAKGNVDKRSLWKKLLEKILRIRFVVEKGSEEKELRTIRGIVGD
jgi:hypothetical protein